MTPRVTYEGEIVLDGFTVESSALGPSISVAGQDVPSFSSRKVGTKLRLREGESTLLAGLLRDEQRKILTGFPGIMKRPVLRSLFGSTSDKINQTDIVMLLTPHIVRTHELTVEDLAPIYIGTQQNVGLAGPPPLIAPQPNEPPAAAAPARRRRDRRITTDADIPGAPRSPRSRRAACRRRIPRRLRARRRAELPAAASAASRQSAAGGASRRRRRRAGGAAASHAAGDAAGRHRRGRRRTPPAAPRHRGAGWRRRRRRSSSRRRPSSASRVGRIPCRSRSTTPRGCR